MEHIPKVAAQKFEKGPVTSWEYPMQEASLNVAPISIRGRYPEVGYTENNVVDSVVYVMSGTGVLGIKGGEDTLLNVGDQVHIAVRDSYYFVGELDILYAATPPWTPDQTSQSS
jgi:hypothetical protein